MKEGLAQVGDSRLEAEVTGGAQVGVEDRCGVEVELPARCHDDLVEVRVDRGIECGRGPGGRDQVVDAIGVVRTKE